MKINVKGMFSRHGFAHAASYGALALAFLALPGLLSAQTLLHRYSFVSDASDSVGTANGTLVAPSGGSAATITNGLSLPGGGGGGFSGYLALPSGILTNTTNLTVECWATQNPANSWATIWDFGNNGSQNFELCPHPDPGRNGGNMIAAFTPNNGENDLNTPTTFPTGSEQYVAVTYNNSTLTAHLYYNGALDGTVNLPNATYCPGTYGGAGGTADNWLGRNVFNDPQFQGTVYELRIWNGVVSQRYLEASAILGSGALVTNLTPTSANVVAGTNLIITGTEQATVSVTLSQTGSSELLATSDATNWTTSNPNVLAVNSSGLITGIKIGTATVSAKVGGVTATSGTITVTGPQTLLHRYSFVSDASDSVGGANGTIVAPGNVNGTNVTINNGLTLPGGGGGGYSGYVTLPSGILTNTTSLTVECWLTQNQANTWATPWDFANNGNQNFGLIPDPGNNGHNMEVAFTPHGNEIDLQSGVSFPNGAEQYVAVTYNNFTLTGNLYTNGALVAATTFPDTTYAPGGIGGGTTVNALGNDIYNDTQFQGIIYEFRIWDGALPTVFAEVSAAAGPGVIVTNLTPVTLNVTVTNYSMIGAQTQPAIVVGNFMDASGVTVTSAATNWISSNPNVLTVNSSGLITAQSGGSATVSATVSGVAATSAPISVANTSPILPQKPANLTVVAGESASFTVGALGGGLNYQWSFGVSPIAGATNATLTLANVAFTNAGTYSVMVSNNLGSTNVSALLTVVTQLLRHRYSFVSDASDSVGGANGTLVAPNGGAAATINNGLSLPGTTAAGFGVSGYVSLPSGILTNTSSLTVECWVTQNQGNSWAEIWDFGNDGGHTFGLIPYPVNNGNNLEVAFTPHGNEIDLQSAISFPDSAEQYVAVTFNSATLTGNLYTNAALIAATTFPDSTYTPGTIGGAGGTTENMLGNDVYGDDQFNGTVYEFRIWDGVVSPVYLAVSAAAGPGVVVTNLTPLSLAITVTNSTMIPGQTQPAAAVGNFADASGVTVTGSATNWTSSNTNVLTVNSNGLITAINTGSATISATVNGATGTSTSITVPTSLPIITQQPEAADNLLVGATLNASVANIGTPPFVYRWFTNNGPNPISTAATPTLTITNLQLANAASYSCLVSNQYGTALSSNLILTVVVPNTYQQAIVSLGPLAYWPLTETDGTVAYDVVGGYNGTYTNAPSVAGSSYSLAQPGPTNAFFGTPSYCAEFLSAYVDIPGGPFNITNAITTVAWVDLVVAPGFDGLIGHGDPSWRMSIDPSSQPGANDGTSASGDATSPTSIFDNHWHMVAYTYTGVPGQNNNGSLYVDGVLAANNTVVTAPVGDDLDVWIGGSPDYGTARLLPAAGIAHAAIFNQALTAAQVQGLYNGVFVVGPQTITIARSGSNVVLHWQTGTLLQAPTVHGPWTTNNAAAPPYTVPARSGNQFFRLLVSP